MRFWQSTLRRRLLPRRRRRRDPRRTYRRCSSSTARSAPSTSPRPSSRRQRGASTASALPVGRCTARLKSLLESPPPSPAWRLPVRFSVERTLSCPRWAEDRYLTDGWHIWHIQQIFGCLGCFYCILLVNQVTKPEVRERYIHLCFLNYVRYVQLWKNSNHFFSAQNLNVPIILGVIPTCGFALVQTAPL